MLDFYHLVPLCPHCEVRLTVIHSGPLYTHHVQSSPHLIWCAFVL